MNESAATLLAPTMPQPKLWVLASGGSLKFIVPGNQLIKLAQLFIAIEMYHQSPAAIAVAAEVDARAQDRTEVVFHVGQLAIIAFGLLFWLFYRWVGGL